MRSISKIFPFLLLASALSLSSCLNEVKNLVKNIPTDTSSIPIDTNFLHGFKNVSITFSGACKYFYRALQGFIDTSIGMNYYSKKPVSTKTVAWTGKYFQLFAYLDTGFSNGPDTNGLGFARTLKNTISMKC